MKIHIINSDQFIVDLNKKRDSAWYKLYEEFYPALCSYAERIACGNAGVEDIVQECMIGLWDSSFQFPNVEALAGWLYKSVYTRTLNLIRNQDNSRRILDNYVAEKEYSEEIAVDMAIEESVIARLRLALDRLPEQQSRIMQMSLEGLKVREIAVALNVSENTIKMQKKRAYSIIREQMGEVWGVLLTLFFPINL